MPSLLASVLLFAITVGVSAQNQPVAQVLKPAFGRRDVFHPFSVPGSKATYPLSINDSNTVTGSYIDQSGVVHGFVRDADGTVETFDVPASVFTKPVSINAEGDIAGIYQVPVDPSDPLYSLIKTIPQGFLRKPDGGITTFGTASGSPTKGFLPQPVAINNAGEVVGNYPTDTLGSLVFIRSPQGVFTDFTLSFGADFQTIVTGLNSGGAVVGWSSSGPDDIGQGFLWSGHGTLPTPGSTVQTDISVAGSTGTFPSGVNAEGTVVGYYTTGPIATQYFVRYGDGVYSTLSLPGSPGCALGGFPETSVISDPTPRP